MAPGTSTNEPSAGPATLPGPAGVPSCTGGRRMKGNAMRLDQLAASPCSNPDMEAGEAIAAYAGLGYRKFEVFTSWAKSAFDFSADPETYLAMAWPHGMRFTSMHLPRIEADVEAGVREAVAASRFARALGVTVVIFKAATRNLYIEAARPYLDAVEGLGVVPAVQNHVGTPITTLEDYRAVLDGVADDRMEAVLEVGMFYAIGVPWQPACDLLDGRIALVHLKDHIGQRRVPFGTGEVDFAGLIRHLDAQGYAGEYVVEMEVDREDRQRTLRLLAEARRFLSHFYTEARHE